MEWLVCVTVSQRIKTAPVTMNSRVTAATSISRTEEWGDDGGFQLPWGGWEEGIVEICLPSLTVEDELESRLKTESADQDVVNTFDFDISDAFPG